MADNEKSNKLSNSQIASKSSLVAAVITIPTFRMLLCLESLRQGPYRDLGERAEVENLSERDVGLPECCSSSFEKNAFVPRR